MKYLLGADIGGTSAKIGIVDENYEIIEKAKVVTLDRTADEIIESIGNVCRELAAKYPVEYVGIGSPGRVVRETGIVERAGHLPFSFEPVAPRISAIVGLPAFIDNDANCALIGEKAAGAIAGHDDAILLTLGTGIGGSVLIGDRVMRGHNNRAGELGHFSMDLNGEVCECGLRGCFEMQASATALIALTRAAAEENPESLLAVVAKDEGIDGRTLFTAAGLGCPTAKKALDEYGRRLAMGIDSISYIFQPQIIVLSGGVSRAGEQLLQAIAPHRVADNPLAVSTLQGDGGLIGAALLGTDKAL